MFPNIKIISTIYYRVTTCIHIYHTIFVLQLVHVNINYNLLCVWFHLNGKTILLVFTIII